MSTVFKKFGLVLLVVVFSVGSFGLAGCDSIKNLTDPNDKKDKGPTPVGNLVISNMRYENQSGCNGFARFDYSGAVGGVKEVYALTYNGWQLVTNYRVTGTTEGTIFEEGYNGGTGYGRYITDNSGQISNTLEGKLPGC